MNQLAKNPVKLSTYQTVYNINHRQDYTILGNETIRNTHLSDFSHRILQMMLSMPKDFRFYRQYIANYYSRDIKTVQKSLSELRDFGYLEYIQATSTTEGYYIIYEQPKKETLRKKVVRLSKKNSVKALMGRHLRKNEPQKIKESPSNQESVKTEPESLEAQGKPDVSEADYKTIFNEVRQSVSEVISLTADDHVVLKMIYRDYMDTLTTKPRMAAITKYLLSGLKQWKHEKKCQAIRETGKEEKALSLVQRDIMTARNIYDGRSRSDHHHNDGDWADPSYSAGNNEFEKDVLG